MLDRGIFFDGDDTLSINNLVLNNVFTVEFWIRPYIDENPNASLLSVGESYADFRISDALPVFTFDGSDLESNSALGREWTQIVYELNQRTLKILVNEALDLEDTTTITNLFIDLMTNSHILGTNYLGFMYGVCLKNRISTDFTEDPGLSICNHDEYIAEDGSCEQCQDEC